MEHNLDDSLNLDSTMGVEYEPSEDAVVSQSEVTLISSSHQQIVPMEFEHIEEHSMLMDTENEEIIVTDFMSDQFINFQDIQTETSQPDESVLNTNNQSLLVTQPETMSELQFEQPQIMTTVPIVTTQDDITLAKPISGKSILPPRRMAIRKDPELLTTPPRQVAIAPKPDPQRIQAAQKSILTTAKQFSIAPKPVTLVANRAVNFKKMSLTGVMQGNKNVIGQIGKQLFMVPANSTQNLKLVSHDGTKMSAVQIIKPKSDQAQLIPNQTTGATTTPIIKKLVVQSDVANQPTMITKLVPTVKNSSIQPQYVMHHKSVPITLSNKMIVTTPSKGIQGNAKRHQIIIKSPNRTLVTTQQQSTQATTKKVIITAAPAQNVLLKTTPSAKSFQVTSRDSGSKLVQGQRTRLHKINVPGKGVQYIQLITNPPAPTSPTKPVSAVKTKLPPVQKTFILASEANLIPMTDQLGQPPPLAVTKKAKEYSPQKLVRLAPVTTRPYPQQLIQINKVRSPQSLLAPLTQPESQPEELITPQELEPQDVKPTALEEPQTYEIAKTEMESQGEEDESKATLRALLEQAMNEDSSNEENANPHVQVQEVEVEFRHQSSMEELNSSGLEQHDTSTTSGEHPLIVIPAAYSKAQESGAYPRPDVQEEAKLNNNEMQYSIETEIYQSPESSQEPSEAGQADIQTELSARPRKPCNCTKSQCLKLYCDCFANGEFCNQCNCNNCRNNLENEEPRQLAIKGCLFRNPNAFKPKIGKAKLGGPEIIRRHYKGCNCKRSGCLKNYCECYEAKISCTAMCKCVGCRNVEETIERARRRVLPRTDLLRLQRSPPPIPVKQPCSFMTSDVIEAVCQCMLAAGGEAETIEGSDPVRDVIDEFSRCLQDIILAAHQPASIDSEGLV